MSFNVQVNQIYQLVNDAANQTLGREDINVEDLQQLVDTGEAILSTTENFNTFIGNLLPRINDAWVAIRKYVGYAPNVMVSGREWGAILQKISIEMPDSSSSNPWNLRPGTSYDPNVYNPAKVRQTLFTDRTTHTIKMSITRRQLKAAFSSLAELDAFIAGIFTAIDNRMTMDNDNMVMRTIGNAMAETIYAEYPESDFGTKSGVRAVNLLYLYNHQTNVQTPLTVDKCMTDPEFIRFAAYQMGLYHNRLSAFSTLFNLEGFERHTPAEDMKIVMLADFKSAAGVYLQSDTFHNSFTALPEADTVPFWQGSGKNFSFNEVSDIHYNTADNHEVAASGILCCMFDRWALGVRMIDYDIRTHYNADGDFVNYWYEYTAGYYNDKSENMVVFFVA